MNIEAALLRMPRGLVSRLRIGVYRSLGLSAGIRNRIEGGGRCRRLRQIHLGAFNAFTQGCWLWPVDEDFDGIRIRIGDRNYFNRDVMVDACGYIQIGSDNMFGPGVYITDSNHGSGQGLAPGSLPMERGRVTIGNRCWVGAKAVILMNVELGDGCIVGAGAVVTKSFPAGSVIVGVPGRLLR